jgi:hypothetical protein
MLIGKAKMIQRWIRMVLFLRRLRLASTIRRVVKVNLKHVYLFGVTRALKKLMSEQDYIIQKQIIVRCFKRLWRRKRMEM